MLQPGSTVMGSAGQMWTVERLLGSGTCCHVYQAAIQGEERKVSGRERGGGGRERRGR